MRPSLLISSEAEVSQKALGDAVSTSMVMWFVIFLAALLVVILVAVSQAPPGAERERTPARPKAARPATARPRQTRPAPPFRSGSPPQGGLPAQNGRPARGATQDHGMPLSRDLPPGARHAMPPAAVPPPPAVPAGPMFPSALPAAPVAPGQAASPGYGPPFPPARRPHRCWTRARPARAVPPDRGRGTWRGTIPRRPAAGTYAPSPGGLSVTPPPVALATVGARAPAIRGRLARFRGPRPPGDVSGRCACSLSR